VRAIELFVEAAREGVYPGAQLAISKEGRRLASVATGALWTGGPPTNPTAVYDLASLTKPLATAMLVGRAIERGGCRLEDPIERFVPGVDPRVTIEHALEHAAGFAAHRRFDLELAPTAGRTDGDPTPSEFAGDRRDKPACRTDGDPTPSEFAGDRRDKPACRPDGDPTPSEFADAFRAIVARAAREPLEALPGARALYSDVGFILLGAALEAIFERPLSALFEAPGVLFRDRRFGEPPALAAPFAPTEGCRPGEVHDENARAMGGAAGHAGLFGTADAVLDLAECWLRAFHGERGGILEPETVRRLWRPSAVPGSTRTLGWDRPAPEGSSTGGRWPAQSVGHLGFTGTSIWIEPERALAVVLVSNRVCPSRENNAIRRLRPALHDAVWEELG
jgi:CubicO group peptidase (beta-lactamase class C family)